MTSADIICEYVAVGKFHILGQVREGTKWNLADRRVLFQTNNKDELVEWANAQPPRMELDVVLGVRDPSRPTGYRGFTAEEMNAYR